jgi:hypothetical protein
MRIRSCSQFFFKINALSETFQSMKLQSLFLRKKSVKIFLIRNICFDSNAFFSVGDSTFLLRLMEFCLWIILDSQQALFLVDRSSSSTSFV